MATGDHFQLGELNGAGNTTILRGEASEDGSQDFNGTIILKVEADTGSIRRIRHDCDGIVTSGQGSGRGLSAQSDAGDGVLGVTEATDPRIDSSGVRGESK